MINQINHPFSDSQEKTNRSINTQIIGSLIGAGLTIGVSFFGAGLLLVGLGFLSFAFGLILTSMVNYRINGESNWGTVLWGQVAAVCGMAVLLFSYFH